MVDLIHDVLGELTILQIGLAMSHLPLVARQDSLLLRQQHLLVPGVQLKRMLVVGTFEYVLSRA